jgi:hypothetical protein
LSNQQADAKPMDDLMGRYGRVKGETVDLYAGREGFGHIVSNCMSAHFSQRHDIATKDD